MKKKIFSVFPFIVFLLGGCSSMYNITDYEAKKLTISETSTVVCFGDSLTYGHGADSATESWPALIQKNISIPVINSGKDDDTTLDGVNRFQTDVLDFNPAILIIDFGGNDIYNFSKKQSYSEIEQNFRTMLEQVDFTQTQVYIMRFFNDEMRFLDFFGAFNKILKRLEKEYDVIIIWDAWKGAWGHNDCKYDMTHCNAKGYKIMAKNILSVLEPCLKANDIFVEK
ncbi:MAG: GDSL-type esterase/lipase family protein [Treponema sp.]|nr:GDSL-type esterase/lipase family protein [Treponema sp.]